MATVEVEVDLAEFSTEELAEELSSRMDGEFDTTNIADCEKLCTMIIEGRAQEALELIGQMTGGKVNSAVYIQCLQRRAA